MTRRIHAHLETSLDGVVEHPEKWAHDYFAPDMLEAVQSDMGGGGTVLFGRRTYEEFAQVWPSRGDDDPFARFLNSSEKLVASHGSPALPWGPARVVSGDEVGALKEEAGPDVIVLGSITLVGSLLRGGVLDQLELFVMPVVIGSGQRLFDGPDSVRLRLTESRRFSNGVLLVRYAPERKE